MVTIRIGNDIDVLWKVFSRNGQRFYFDGMETSLWLISGPFKKEIKDYVIQNHNEVSFSIDADDIRRYGVYKMQLSVLDANAVNEDATIDVTEVFQIVSRNYVDTNNPILDGYVLLTPSSVLNNIVSVVEEGTAIAADEEDITVSGDLLKFKDRDDTLGLGYKILRRSASFASQVTDADTIYEIRYDFNLGGATVTVPTGCVLKAAGGKLSNGSLVCQGTAFESDGETLFDPTLVLSGTFAAPLKLSLFGIAGDRSTNAATWKATTFPGSTAYDVDSNVVFSAGDIVVPRLSRINGNGHRFTFTATTATIGLLVMSYRCFVQFLDVFCAQEYEGDIVAANGPFNSVHDFRLANMTISGAFNLDNDYRATGLKIYADNSQNDKDSKAITGCVVTNIRFEWVKYGIDISAVNYEQTDKYNFTWMNSLFFSNIYIIATKEGILTYYKNYAPSDKNTPNSTGYFIFDKIEYQARLKEYETGYEPEVLTPQVTRPGIDGAHQSMLLQTGDFGFTTYIRDSISWDTSCLARVAVGSLYTWNVKSPGSYDNGEQIGTTAYHSYAYPATGTDEYSDEYGDYTLLYRTVKLYGSAKLFREFQSSNGVEFLSDDYTQASGTQKFSLSPTGQRLDLVRQGMRLSSYFTGSGNEAAFLVKHVRSDNYLMFGNNTDDNTQNIQWLARNVGSPTSYRIIDFARQIGTVPKTGDFSDNELNWRDAYDNKEVYSVSFKQNIAEGSTAMFQVLFKFVNSGGTMVNYSTYSSAAICPLELRECFSKVWAADMDISDVHYAVTGGNLLLYFSAKAFKTFSTSDQNAIDVYFEVAYKNSVTSSSLTETSDGLLYAKRMKNDFLQYGKTTLLGIAVPSGPGTDRPTYSGLPVGFMYYDSTLNKPIWIKANAGGTVTWVDATGTEV